MEKLNQIVYSIMVTLQLIADAVISILFQPIYILLQLIQSIIIQWSEPEDMEEGEEEPQYKEPVHIQGFQNQAELEELDRIKKQLNK